MMGKLAQVILRSGKAKPFFGRHPWVLASAIDRLEGQPADGDVVELCTQTGHFVARGVWNSRSRIRVRLYSWRPEEALDDAFWHRRLEEAVRLRNLLGYTDAEGAARLVYSEADGLSGLIVDRYAQYLVVQITAAAMASRLPLLVDWLVQHLQPKGILLRTDPATLRAEGLPLDAWEDRVLWGTVPSEPVEIREHGLRYLVDLAQGQKTGFYLDQRENRQAVADFCRGRTVLDMFCYTGGFALAAAAAGAETVLGIDDSQKAVQLAQTNAQLNGFSNVRFEQGDCFKTMQRLLAENQRFGCVVLDPPRFARSRRSVPRALQAYHWLNRLGVELLEPGGILVTCSCSGHVSRADFLQMLMGVSQKSARPIQILQQRGAAPDHPVLVTCPETDYLKCFICRVG
ncbi:MAG: class I SAM-dependent rRNA methyltransferase [Thermoguttaceae bacterium]|nr:class I SAM-dependent rRNA methyltransferase [Thermoguttaceae bacterium]MDW8037167.1 class I SAM-dependent rRNA methyltransferase [Thermoguttaceae bacterium]